jgi:hypothetical protein
MADSWLWQGFSAQWQYNHRLNRLGSAVVNGEDAAHSAASGTGPDAARIATCAVQVSRETTAFHTGEVTLRFQGPESVLHTATQTVFVPDAALGVWSNAEAVLQGFDTYAAASADKPQQLSFEVGEARHVSGGWSFPVNARWMGACTTAECSGDGTTDQTLKVYYALIASNDTLRLSTDAYAHQQTWTKKEKPMASQAALVGTQGIQRVSLTLSDEMHWLGYETRIDDHTLSMGFENWKPGMKWAHPLWSLFSFRQAGSARTEVQTVELAVKTTGQTCIETERPWPGRGRSADSQNATDRTSLSATR